MFFLAITYFKFNFLLVNSWMKFLFIIFYHTLYGGEYYLEVSFRNGLFSFMHFLSLRQSHCMILFFRVVTMDCLDQLEEWIYKKHDLLVKFPYKLFFKYFGLELDIYLISE